LTARGQPFPYGHDPQDTDKGTDANDEINVHGNDSGLLLSLYLTSLAYCIPQGATVTDKVQEFPDGFPMKHFKSDREEVEEVSGAIADSFDGIMEHSALRHFFVVAIPR
jgi:hypothetical protein